MSTSIAQVIETTKQLIAIPSTADNPAALGAALDVLTAIIQRQPEVTIERFSREGKPSILAYRGKTRPSQFDILLNAHVDVVPGAPALFTPEIRDGKLYGRGALDMKGTAAVLTDVFCELVNVVPYALGLQIVTDEEIGGYNGVRLQIDEGVRANFAVMGEYANDRRTIYNAARGLCWAEIKFKGKSAHGGHLWHGSNAVVKAGDFAGAVLKRYPTPDKETWTTTASIANLYTPNEAYNKVPDSAILKIDFRFTQEDPVFHSRKSLTAFIGDLDPEAELINLATFEPAVNVEQLNPYVQGLSVAMQEITGTKPRFLGRPASSDGRHYALVGVDIIEFGLYGKNSHSDGEYVEIASFDEYRSCMLAFLRQPIPPANILKASRNLEPLRVELLKHLVGIKSLSGDVAANNAALLFIGEFLQARGMFVERYESGGVSSLLATTRPSNLKPTVLLSAHTDVVPAAAEHFKVTRKNGKFYGRGVMDMKFAIAGYMCLVDALKDDLGSYDFGILITSDEEVGGRHGTSKLVREGRLRPKVAIVPDGGENWNTETFAKGVQWIKLAAVGKSGHASRPWEGTSAITALLAALRDIEQLIPPTSTRKDTTLTIGTIEGGSAGNQIPASASAMLDIRYGSLQDYEEFSPRIMSICRRHGITATILVSDPPCINRATNPYIKSFRQHIARVTGVKPGTSYGYGATDGRYFSAAGIPAVIVAPESGGRHTDAEWLSEAGFEQFCTIIEQYVRSTAISATRPAAAKPVPGTIKTDYVWFASYGTGLLKENFLRVIAGGKPDGALRSYQGIDDKAAPLEDRFIALPHTLYFAGESKAWGGGAGYLKPKPSPKAHTIAHGYLVSIRQLEELVAAQNWRTGSTPLPLEAAIKTGKAPIGQPGDDYDLLLYCGTKNGHPIFAISSAKIKRPAAAPSAAYTRLLCEGLTQDKKINTQEAVDYMLAQTGIAEHYEEQELVDIFEEAEGR